ncbi:MAG: leucine-rich repeat domain-containing protein [Christensenellales bacterium]
MRKGDVRKKRSKLTYILPIFVLLLIGIGCLGLSKNSNNINKENDKIEEMATGYMSEEIEKLKNEDDENLISKEYLVTDNVIKKVKENTSIEEFKKSFEREVKVYTDEAMDEEITDGIIKTGMTVADKEDTYIAVVDGDVSKDGKVDQIDISKMIRQETDEIGKVEASEYGIEKVARKIVYGEYELEKVKEVEKPEIKVVNGQQGENEWYTTDVELEINQKEEQGKKTVYKIKGTEEKEETQIEEGQKVTIDRDGIYKVIAYTYGEEGNRSRITYEIIKVNKTGIEATINYSTTESTTDPVIATVTFNKEGIKITNNEGKNTYEFTENGEFTFEYVDEAGRIGSITAKVDWIKKKEVVGQDGEWKYFVNSDNTIQLTQYLGTKTELVVPANYDGYEVYAVGVQGLEESTPSAERINVLGTSENATITKLTIEEGIKEIKCSAFEKCTGIKGNLVIPDSVETIEGYAFNSCSGFNGTLTLPSTLKSIENRAFQLCSGFKDDLVIPEGIKSIGDGAFNKCTGFNGTLTLPSTLKSISNGAFQYCSGLTGDILIPEGVETLGTHVFNKCTGFNGTITLPSTLKEIGRNSFYNCNKLTGNLVIPEGIEIINPNTFRGCSSLNGTLTLPSTLKEISNFAFYGCKNLKGDINIPDNVISIGDQAFYNCTGFDGYIRLSNKLESIGGWTFGNCSKLVGDLIIPDSVTNILDSTFRNCSSLNGKLVISNNITKLEEGVFSGCSNLVGELVIPAGVKTIGKAAFQQCEKLNGKLVLPEGLEYIGDFAFNKCTSFENTTIKIPASLKKMGEDYDLNGNNVGIGSHFFYNFGANVRKFEAFEVEEGNNNFVAIDGVLYTKDLKRLVCYPRNKKDKTYEIQEGVELLDQMSIASNMTLSTLILPDSLIIKEQTYPQFTWENDYLLDYSLYNYNAIENIEVKDTNPNYKSNDGVLYTKDMKNLVYISSGRTKEVIIPDGVETINDNSIYWSQVARSVSKMYIPASVTNISDSALKGVNNGFIKKIEISEDNPSFTLGSNGKLIRK